MSGRTTLGLAVTSGCLPAPDSVPLPESAVHIVKSVSGSTTLAVTSGCLPAPDSVPLSESAIHITKSMSGSTTLDLADLRLPSSSRLSSPS